MLSLSGVYTALVTPFRNGEVDYPALRALLQEQLDAKVAGVVPVGTSGESPTLSVAEHIKVIEETIKFVAGRCQVIAGTGANSTREALEFTTIPRQEYWSGLPFPSPCKGTNPISMVEGTRPFPV